MAVNVAQPFPALGHITWAASPMTLANTTRDGTGGTLYPVLTTGTNGDQVGCLRFQSLGSNGACVVRVWVNNGSSTGSAANNILLGEMALPQTTASELTTTPPVPPSLSSALIFPINAWIQAGYVIFCTISQACAAGWTATAVSASY